MVDWVALGITALAIIIILLVIWILWIVFRSYKGRREEGPSHFELYFAENFRNLIDEWDLQTRSKMKVWKGDMSKRLNIVGNDIERLKAFQKTMDTRLERLTKEIVKLEGH